MIFTLPLKMIFFSEAAPNGLSHCIASYIKRVKMQSCSSTPASQAVIADANRDVSETAVNCQIK